MQKSDETPQPQIGSVAINGRHYTVSVLISYDGVEYAGRLWFAEDDWEDSGIPDRGLIPGRSKQEVMEYAKKLSPSDLTARYRRALANKRRYLALRNATEEMLRKIRYLNQVAVSMHAGLIDLDGAAQEIDVTEQQMHEIVTRLRDAAGEESPA
ncbi:MAG: hypothetical protein M3068_05290 [Gemmatimonadota bacterium]|nr:hypothetical protein [Gemmatimonadota bacterium]